VDAEKLLNDIKNVARRCGSMILEADNERIAAKEKSGFRDLVTKYDVAVQEFAISELTVRYPDSEFICEEGTPTPLGESRLTFVIDPIDGTANFVHHLRHSCTSIACLLDGEPYVGAVYDPYADEMFSAIRGSGAWLNGHRLKIEGHPLSESIVIFGTSPYNNECADETFVRARRILDMCQDLRRTGSAALDLCYVAAGRAGLFFESILSLWDYGAAALIVSEAGGACMTLSGEPLPYKGRGKISCVAGHVRAIEESGLVS
jgi:myo-inositol-1(or 4)-monophosphatase